MSEQLADAFLNPQESDSLRNAPGPYFGKYGGQWMPESLMAAMEELEETFNKAKEDTEFMEEFQRLSREYSNRPSLLTEAPRFSEHAGGVRFFLKREDLNHTGSHKINNVLGQALLTKRMGKTRVIAETGAGRGAIFTGAMRVGRDHIASTVYTLVLAYAGSALPLLLLFSVANRSLGDVLTSESVAIEVARSAVGGVALALSVPLTTAIAAVLDLVDDGTAATVVEQLARRTRVDCVVAMGTACRTHPSAAGGHADRSRSARSRSSWRPMCRPSWILKESSR